MKPLPLALALIVVFSALVGGTFALTAPAPLTAEDLRAAAGTRGTAPLDGQTFLGKVGKAGGPADIEDQLVFDDGLFLSKECERRCGYPARPYFVRETRDGMEFVAETRCPNKDATLVWRGTVRGDTIKGEFTWTSSRWYWTFERTFWFEGKRTEKTAAIETR